MTITNRVSLKSVMAGNTPIADVPDAPTIGVATAGAESATVTYTAAATGGTATTFTATSSPGSITGTGSSPITVSGLTGGTAYTFTVRGSNSTGTSPESAATSPVTPTALPRSFESIATVIVGSGGSSQVEFTSIPQTFTHLQLRYMSRDARTNSYDSPVDMRFNGNSSSSYAKHTLQGDGSTVISPSEISQTYIRLEGGGNSTLSDAFGVGVLDILEYTSTNKNKTIKQITGVEKNGSGFFRLTSGFWANTSAITSITLTPFSSPFAQYSHFALYGIKDS